MTSKRIWLSALAAAAILAAVLGGLSVSARGHVAGDTRGQAVSNAAVDWNAIATGAITAPAPAGAGQPPQAAVLSLAIVQGAVYDAVNAIDGTYEPYLASPVADPGDSKEAAAAAAAFHVLVGLFPSQQATLQPVYDAFLANVPEGRGRRAESPSARRRPRRCSRRGRTTAAEARSRSSLAPTPESGARHRPTSGSTPPRGSANVRPFLVPNVEMLRTNGPNALTSNAYARDFNEVKRLGSLTSTTRTADQTAAAIFWQDSGAAIWNRVFRTLATSEELDIVESARMLAMTNLAAADGSIGCWNDKYYWNFWRPITAIHEAANDGNPATEPDPAWLPLFNPTVPVSGPPLVTPGFPDHPSGHTCISGAIAYTLKAFFGTDKVDFTVVSNKCSPAPCPDRSFQRFTAALDEIIDARVWSGIHFRTADVQGAFLGKEVAQWLRKHYFGHAQ